jgi:hypothetical protein
LYQGKAKEILADILAMFPGLSGLRCPRTEDLLFSRRSIPWTTDLPSLESLSRTAQETLAQPQVTENYQFLSGQLNFFDLLDLVHQSSQSAQLTDISSHGFKLIWWGKRARESDHAWKSLTGLKSLSLDFNSSELEIRGNVPHLEDKHQLRKMLTNLPSIKSLHLSLNSSCTSTIDLHDIVIENQFWEHLTSLSLGTITVDRDVLQRLLARHSTRLRFLELDDVDFEVSRSRTQGSWIEFLHFLNRVLSLDQVKFSNIYFGRSKCT